MSLKHRLGMLHLTASESKFNKVLAQSWGQCALCSSHGCTGQKEVAIAVSTETKHGVWSKRYLCYECVTEVKESGLLDLPKPTTFCQWGENSDLALEMLEVTGGGTVREIRGKAIALGYECSFNLSATLRNMVASDKWRGEIVRTGSGRSYSYAIAEVLENAS